MRYVIFISSLLLILTACGQKGNNKNSTSSQMSMKLNDSATIIAMTQGDFKKAIAILDQATTIDSNNIRAYKNKLTFQLAVDDYTNALVTALKLLQLQPENPDYRVTIGILYDLKGDSINCKGYYKDAIAFFDKKLSETNSSSNSYKILQMNKAINLIFLGQDKEGNDILRDLYSKSKDEVFKEMIASYLNKSKREIFQLMIAPVEGVSEAKPNQ